MFIVEQLKKHSRKTRTVMYAICYGASIRKARGLMKEVNPRMPARKRASIIKELMMLSVMKG